MSSKKYKLSAALFGHSLDVRSVSVTSDNSIISGSRDKTAKFWKQNGFNTGYSEVMTYKDQKNFVVAVLYLEPSQEYPEGLVLAGGNDNTICVYKPGEPFATLHLKEHTNTVSCLSKGQEPNTFLSGSWDCSGKYWALHKGQKSLATFTGHTAAIWGIIQLKDSRILTASADKTISIWTSEGQKINVIKAHTDCVRGLLDLPELKQFISVSNDASVKVWSYSGENLDTYWAHTNYIYSIARCAAKGENSFVTSDEDRTVRFWVNGVNTESIQLPAQSVWSVDCLSNGDIVTGSSDGIVRVFTQDDSRLADPETLAKFNEEVEALTKQSMQEIGGYKVSDLPGREALYDPGKKEGQMKMIRENNGVVAYTWVVDGENSHWEKVGDVLGGTNKDNQDKTTYEGKSYDFVFSVDVEDGKPPLKLPYNKGQDPYQAANEFLTKHVLPADYLEQVVDFILKNANEQYVPSPAGYVDPFTGGSRYTPSGTGGNNNVSGVNYDPFTGGSSYSTGAGQAPAAAKPSAGSNADPFTGSSSYTSLGGNQQQGEVKYFPVNTYKTFDMGDSNVILGKLKEFNGKLKHGKTDEAMLEAFVNICKGPPNDAHSFDVLFNLLDWPEDVIFPVLDVVRLAVRHQKNNEIISVANGGSVLKKLMCFTNEKCNIVNNLIVTLRALCNLFSHIHGEELVYEHRFDLVENITSLSALNKNAQIAISTLLLNLSICCLKKKDDIGISVLAEVVPDILTKLTDPEAQFRCYVALGNLLTAGTARQIEEVKAKVKSNDNFISTLQLHLLTTQGDLEVKKRNCALQVRQNLSLSF